MLSKKSASSPGILKSKRKCELQQYGLYNVEKLLFLSSMKSFAYICISHIILSIIILQHLSYKFQVSMNKASSVLKKRIKAYISLKKNVFLLFYVDTIF